MGPETPHDSAQFTSPVALANLLPTPSAPPTSFLPRSSHSCCSHSLETCSLLLVWLVLTGPFRSQLKSACPSAKPSLPRQSIPSPLSLCPTAYCLFSHKSSVFVIICGIIGQTTHSLDCTLLERRNHAGLLYCWLLNALAQMPDTHTRIHSVSIYIIVTPWASHLTSRCLCFLSVK